MIFFLRRKLMCWWKGHQWKEWDFPVRGMKYTCGRCWAWTEAIPLPSSKTPKAGRG